MRNSLPATSAPSEFATPETKNAAPAGWHYWFEWTALAVVLLVYCYPALRSRVELGPTPLPPMFAPDLSLYVNLCTGSAPNGEFQNPYYLVNVPYAGAGYLKFHSAPALFEQLRAMLQGQLWISVFVWNLLWWTLLSGIALRFFRRFLPEGNAGLPVLGLMVLMLCNFGVLKTLLMAWAQLPSMAGFDAIGLPFMRAFVPVIPATFLLGYLGLQMEALRRKEAWLIWFAMGVVQFAALMTFPYATLMVAGITAVSAAWEIFSGKDRRAWLVVLVYGVGCAIIDGAFALRGSLSFYSGRTSLIEFHPELIRHLIGGNWLLLGMLTAAVLFSSRLTPELKWPLAGLGATNLVLLLGDALVPARTILLSHHAGHFLHESIAILLIFLLSSMLSKRVGYSWQDFATVCAVLVIIANGVLLSVGTYRGFHAYNQRDAALASVFSDDGKPRPGDLVIAPSRIVDDLCGWTFVLTKTQVLYCTDAEVMLTPQQNLEIHRFRQAVYLYLTGRDSVGLHRALSQRGAQGLMYELGYWAEAVSPLPADEADGIRRIETELIPLVERVEHQESDVRAFFHRFRRIVVVDDPRKPIFSEARLAIFLEQETQGRSGVLQVRTYAPR